MFNQIKELFKKPYSKQDVRLFLIFIGVIGVTFLFDPKGSRPWWAA